jgi:hypothetical protein
MRGATISHPHKSKPESAAELAWAVLARRYQHEQRLCADVENVDKAVRDLEQEKAWSDKGDYASLSVELAIDDVSRNRMLDCLAKIRPLPPPPTRPMNRW